MLLVTSDQPKRGIKENVKSLRTGRKLQGSLSMNILTSLMKKYLIKFLDWYIQKYHTHDFVHVSKIQDEIARRIKRATDRNNKRRDAQEERLINAERMKHKIVEDGYCAEIERMESEMKTNNEMRDQVERLYYTTMERARALVHATAEVKHEREEIVNDISKTMGKLDKLELNAKDIYDQIEDSKENDIRVLEAKK